MRLNWNGHYVKRIFDACLTASVHFDAFRIDPSAYLTATKWWIKRKRVRARGQFAPLLSRSRRAYSLWVLRQESEGLQYAAAQDRPFILALIDIRQSPDSDDLAATCKNLSEQGIAALLVGSPEAPALADAMAQIDWDGSPWLILMQPGDRIEPYTAAAYGAAMNDPAVRLIYADDDLLIGHRRCKPYFKPDWNAELFIHHDYLTGACMLHVRRADLEAVIDAADWPQRLTARMAGQGLPLHIHEMLHHRRSRPVPRIPAKPLDLDGDLPAVSIIVPTRNRVDLLRTCLDGVAATDYPDVEVIVMDNDSDDPDTLHYLATLDPTRYKVLHHSGAFNYSAINNAGVAEARGRLLCLLNNDIEVIEPFWLAKMATQAIRPDVGAVGARLLYPDGRIQHAGVAIGVGNAAGHAHRFLRRDEEGYFHRHNLPQFATAVTAACLVVKREKFLAVGGLDARAFPVAFNDVDLCLRLNQRGWQSFYEPRATLIHHESVSRGLDRDPVGAARFAGELAALKGRWKTDQIYDPFHHPHLSRASEQFAVAL
jgi:GT2 family glycosyltransferase